MNKNEFDEYIKNYRINLNKSLSISGETSDFFAVYKAKKLHEWFVDLVPKRAHILDYGCGDGTMANYVKKNFSESKVYGVDPSILSVEYASEHYKNIEFSHLKNNKIDFAPNTFDLIYAAGVFHHIPFSQHEHFFLQIMKSLKPNGYFVLFELNPYNPLTQMIFRRCPIDQKRDMLSSRYAKKLLNSSMDDESIKVKYYCFFPKFLKKLRIMEKYITWLPLGALYACIVKKQKGLP